MMQRPESKTLPTTPGVYLYRNSEQRIIYVGKARHLRKRVLSYFRGEGRISRKTVAMLEKAVSVETISTSTEKEALLLEASLIKAHHPHYNIVLRDDKQYVLFRLARDEAFPRLEIVRQRRKDRARYFGPFASGAAARETWKSIHRVFPLRRCSKRAFANRVRPCLYYDLGQCLAPCTKEVSSQTYSLLTQRVEMLLSGRSRELMHVLEQGMQAASEALEYEVAAQLRDQLRAVEQTVERQSVVLSEGGNVDILGVTAVNGGVALGLLLVREGRLLDSRTFFWPGLELEDVPEVAWAFLEQFYSGVEVFPSHIVVDVPAPDEMFTDGEAFECENTSLVLSRCECVEKEYEGNRVGRTFEKEQEYVAVALNDEQSATSIINNVRLESAFQRTALESMLSERRGSALRIVVPRNTSESRLVDMAVCNAREAALRRENESMGVRLARVFQSKKTLDRIECVDVSHTGGEATRVGMVVFSSGQALKRDYRIYSIHQGGGDDYAALSEWATRRVSDGEPWPDMVLIDGGRGQLSAVLQALQNAFENQELPFLVSSIAKARDAAGRSDRRAGNIRDRIFIPGRSNPLALRDGAPELLFLQHVRDTAHRFVIGRHRRARARQALSLELLRVPGIGQGISQKLWAHFDSLDDILNATPEALQAVEGIGKKTAYKLAQRLAVLSKERIIVKKDFENPST